MATVFSDAFTVGADAGITSYDAASYVYVLGSGTQATVNAANDRVQQTNTGSDIAVRIQNGAVPTAGDGIVSILAGSGSTGDHTANPCVRMATDNSQNFYMAYIKNNANGVSLYRRDPGSPATFVSLSDTGRTIGDSHTLTFKAVTSGSNVNLTLTISTLADVTYSDSHANRKLNGTPGFHMYCDTANIAWIDNLSVDDSASTTPITVNTIPTDNLAGGEIV